MGLQWSQGLSVGNKEIDDQHKELFARVDQLIEAMQKGKEEVGNVIKFLESYVLEHFGMEERYMVKLNYPGFSAHKEEHTTFINTFNEIKRKFIENGATVDIVIKTQSRLGDWLRSHIPVVDKELAVFIVGRDDLRRRLSGTGV